MKRPAFRGRSLLAILLTAIVAAAAALLPLKLFDQQEETLFGKVYPLPNTAGKIDPQAEEILLVNAIRSIYTNGYTSSTPSYDMISTHYMEEVPRQLAQLTEMEVLDASLYHWMDMGDLILDYSYKGYNDGRLTINEYILFSDTTEEIPTEYVKIEYHELVFLMEERTNKLITLRFLNNPILLDKNGQMDIMKKYVAYLDLDILGDWVYNGIGLISPKAQLQVICHTTPYFFLLQIVPFDFYRQHAYAFTNYWGMEG
ncbi:MAG: hypothetical protein HFJ80_06910 [Clostridiales bacterium]|nr:hypothetical protein [Clostridiales bacterium]